MHEWCSKQRVWRCLTPLAFQMIPRAGRESPRLPWNVEKIGLHLGQRRGARGHVSKRFGAASRRLPHRRVPPGTQPTPASAQRAGTNGLCPGAQTALARGLVFGCFWVGKTYKWLFCDAKTSKLWPFFFGRLKDPAFLKWKQQEEENVHTLRPAAADVGTRFLSLVPRMMKKERRNPFGGWCNGNKVGPAGIPVLFLFVVVLATSF